MKTLITIFVILSAVPLIPAQIAIVNSGATGSQINLGQTYTQNFDSLANTGTASSSWTNNQTLPAWYAHQQSTGTLTSYNPSTGPASGGLSSLGLAGNTDRALGTGLNVVAGDVLNFGVQFVNNSSATINGFTVSFDGEQWQRMQNLSGASDSLVFSYQIFDTGLGRIDGSGWTPVSGLTFSSPVNVGTGSESLNGNLDPNRVAGIQSSVTGVSLSSAQELWIRWTATNIENFSDHTLAIDNLAVSFSAIPEPMTAALFGGLATLGTVAVRRRRSDHA
jgi:hypothetical protein